MNALIVDDDRFVVIALEKGIDWKTLGIDNVFKAYRIEEAKEIINNNQIDILLSDIDMPQGSGIDLLEYLRENGYNLPAIFLTNYADFNYAKRALELKSFHYYLKPIDYDELSIIIKDALLESVSNASKNKTARDQLWVNYLLQKQISPDDFLYKLKAFDSAVNDGDQFIVSLFQIYPYVLKDGSQIICQYSNINDIYEQITKLFISVFGGHFSTKGLILPYQTEENLLIALVPVPKDEGAGSSHFNMIKTQAEEIVFTTKEKLMLHSSFFISKAESVLSLPSTLDRLLQLRKDNANNIDKVLTLSHFDAKISPGQPLDTDILMTVINSKDWEQFYQLVLKYSAKLKANGALTGTTLSTLYFEINKLLYTYLDELDIPAQDILSKDSYQFFNRHISLSEYYFRLYLDYIVQVFSRFSEPDSEEQSIIKLFNYVDTHFKDEISRNDLADMFFFDPDYITKIFKREKGMSYMDYIIEKRMELAKKLLTETNTPVRDISLAIGYDNYSYFTRLFKKKFGITPAEYRKVM
ncbi:two-component system, response regulator YesN [Oribacterium sp. KHPX15]|uniref:response regulator transcription factor n=1 Tax=Oribacterium sp. KHPX15 TaxID=1855342 RepID=UPI00089488D1|nr:helix-turn-helix domain-containing protein [Oribacterium sp. KHPX15]SEA00568.1 two-component system, response regulator YesN [Oribacterium sp. KHPX15]